MKVSEFKKLVRPIIKECVRECIHEVVLESGIISNIISESIKGAMSHVKPSPSIDYNIPSESAQTESRKATKSIQQETEKQEMSAKLSETKKKLLESIGRGAYNGVNLFEGTTPAEEQSGIPNSQQLDPLNNINPEDPGIDISNLMGLTKTWNVLANAKKGK